MISSRSSSERPAVAKAKTSRITSAGLAASWTSVCARIAISSPKRVATSWAWPGAADVAQQRHPVGVSRTSRSKPAARTSTRRAGTSAAATRAAARRRCPARAPAWRRTRRGEAACPRWGVLPMFRQVGARRRIVSRRVAAEPTRVRTRTSKEDSMARQHHGGRPDQGRSHRRPDRAALVRRGSPTPTSPGWSSATSTPRAACWAARSSCIVEDGATDDADRGGGGARSSSSEDGSTSLRRHLQLDAAGDQGPGRRRGQDALHLPRAVRGAGVRPAHLLHRPGAGAAGRPVHPVADARDRGAGRSTCPSADYIWPHVLNARVREVVTANGGTIVGEEYFPLDHMDYRGDGRADRRERRRRRVQHDRAARASTPFFARAARRPASRAAAGSSSARTSTRTS